MQGATHAGAGDFIDFSKQIVFNAPFLEARAKEPKMNLTRTCFEMRTSKGLASHCKTKTTSTFYFSIINASESILQC